ncbi:unnamed protein product [Knipowitschia caucasica]
MPSNSPSTDQTPQDQTSDQASEAGVDRDSPEEGTPASPPSKRCVGRPGRKRKQLLPVSSVIMVQSRSTLCLMLLQIYSRKIRSAHHRLSFNLANALRHFGTDGMSQSIFTDQ